jgi:GTP-binding protein Era
VRSGFVAIVGRPNVGKSTLINAMVGSKVSITSARPQTTRNTIRGVVHRPEAQLVLVDTPGLHKPKTALGHRLNALVGGTLADADAVTVVLDATARIGPGDRLVAERAQQSGSPVVVALNKTDVASRGVIADHLREAGEWNLAAYVPLSARTGDGVSILLDEIEALLPQGPPYFPPDMVTDQPDHILVAEIVREKFLSRLRQELPHSLTAMVSGSEVRSDGSLYFAVDLSVERKSQRGIVIGEGGALLGAAGAEARKELESIFGTKVFLDLKVGVERDWQQVDSLLDRLGF